MRALLSLLIVGVTGPAWAQAVSKEWDRAYGGNRADNPTVLRLTADGGMILGGSSSSTISGEKTQPNRDIFGDMWVVKLDATGQKQWDRTLGGDDVDGLEGLEQTSDGGYLLAGTTNSGISGDVSEPSRGGQDYWLVRLDAQGNKLWDRRLGGDSPDRLSAMCQTADGGCILAGSSVSGTSGEKSQGRYGTNGADGWIIKLDANGRKQWDRTIGGISADELQSIQQTADGGYFLGFFSNSPVSGDKSQPIKGGYTDYWVVKLDASGQKQWDQVLGGSGLDYFVAAQQTTDGGYILGGHTDSGVSGDKSQPTQGTYDYWLVKLDAAGQKQWDRSFGTSVGDTLGALRQTRDGGYLLGGITRGGISGHKTQPNRGSRDFWIVKVDAAGTLQWDATFGGTDMEWLHDLQQTTDEGFLLLGYSYSTATGDRSQPTRGSADYWLVKTTAPLLVTISGGQVLCPGQHLLLTAAAVPGGAAYRWNTGATTATLPVTQPGIYQVTATFPNGQTRTAQHEVRLFAGTLQLNGDSVLCAGRTLSLTATAPGATAYQWSNGATTPGIQVSQPGTYSVVATYAGGCTKQAQRQVRAQTAAPVFSLGSDTTICAGTALLLRAPALNGVSYRWSDGSTGPTLLAQQAGDYQLTITGCETRTASRRIAVQSCLVIPNVITPNGDGLNDRFRIQGLVGADWELRLYNRWGRQVYQTASYQHEWATQAAGRYYYILRQPSTQSLYKGWVEVVQ